jgi:hypothetical protein
MRAFDHTHAILAAASGRSNLDDVREPIRQQGDEL